MPKPRHAVPHAYSPRKMLVFIIIAVVIIVALIIVATQIADTPPPKLDAAVMINE